MFYFGDSKAKPLDDEFLVELDVASWAMRIEPYGGWRDRVLGPYCLAIAVGLPIYVLEQKNICAVELNNQID